MDPAVRRVRDAARRQFGLITREQALVSGFTDDQIQHRLRTGAWVRVRAGVYRVAEVRPTWETDVLAAVLAAGPGAAAARRTAGRIWKLEGIEDDVIQIVVPAGRRPQTPAGAVHLRTRTMRPRDVDRSHTIPRTTPPRTLIDLASVLEPIRLETALDDILRREMTSVDGLRRFLDALGSSGRKGAGLLRVFVDDRDGRAPGGSGPENRLRRLIVAVGEPDPDPQHELYTPGGIFVARIDLAYPECLLGIEFDGYRTHTGKIPWIRDARRRRAVQDLGWVIYPYTSTDLIETPQATVRSVARARRLALARAAL